MKIPNIFTKIASSKWGKNFYKKVLDPKSENFLNQTVPIMETALVSSFYIASTAMQKKIDKDSKTALQLQNVLSGLASVGISIPMNKGVSKLANNVVKYLNPDLIKDCHKVANGLKVSLPIFMSILVSRFLVAVALVPLSSKIRDAVKQHNQVHNKLDIKA